MSLKDKYDFSMIENEAVEYVHKAVENELEVDNSFCKCQGCVVDYVTLALNNVKPRYKSTFLGHLYSDVEQEELYKSDVRNAVLNAMEKVKRLPGPFHDLFPD